METTITVSNPTLKKGTFLEYTSYDIKSIIVNNDNKNSNEHQVQRRYSDFLWLHKSLRERNSGSIIPPLPKKQFLGRFHPHFIENRIRGIEKFLSKVLEHPILGQELYLLTFLEANDVSQAKNIFESCQSNANSGVINWLQTQKNVLTASESSMVKSQVMVETEERIQPILDHMSNEVKFVPKVEETSVALQKQQDSHAALRRKHGEACSQLFEVDGKHDSVVIPSLLEFASTELALADITLSHMTSMNIEVIEPLQRYKSTVFALRASVTSQRNKRANHIAANSAIQRDSVRNPNHDELVAKATRCLNEYVDASNRLDEDFRRYQVDRNNELLQVLQSLANLQVQHCHNTQLCWSELETFLAAETTPQPFSGFFSDVKSTRPPSGVSAATGQWSQSQQSRGNQSSSLLDLEEDVEESEEGRESDFYESV